MYGHSVCPLYSQVTYYVVDEFGGGERPIGHFTMSEEREAYLQLVLGILVCIGFALWVSFSDWTIQFPPPNQISGH